VLTPGWVRSNGLDCLAGPVDRLRLHTLKGLSALLGLPMPESWPRYPAREQVIEYLEMCQQHVANRPHSGEAVDRVEQVDGTWEATTRKGDLAVGPCRAASGHLRRRAGAASRHPDAATTDSGRGRVGVADGASAVVHVRMVGLKKLLSGPTTQVARDHHVPLLDVGSMDQIRQGHSNVHGDLDRCTEDGVVFSDGTQIRVDAVVLATGYRASMGICWSDGRPSVTVLAHQRSPGRPRHSRVSSSAGCTSRPEAWDRLVRRAPWCRRS
jgi:cation diffusion facilitator CzcD-associated flavoprotein CzcO